MNSSTDLLYLLPVLVIAGGSVLILLVNTVFRGHYVAFSLSLLTCAISFFFSVYLAFMPSFSSRPITSLFTVDSYSLLFTSLFSFGTFVTILLSFPYLSTTESVDKDAFYIILLIALLGAQTLSMSSHYGSFILGLEILSVSLYSLIAYRRDRPSVEAGMKYLVLAGVSSAFLLFGMALVYTDLGTMKFTDISSGLSSLDASRVIAVAGLILTITGIGFKLSLVPFHLWVPDIYVGAPAPIAGYIASVSKGALFALMFRYFRDLHLQWGTPLAFVFWLVAVASMFTGNLLALLQNNVKKILGFSSISHMGYLLTAFLAAGNLGTMTVSFYLWGYLLTNLIAFGVVTLVSIGMENDTNQDISNYRGLIHTNPALGLFFTISLFSLAGIPLTALFIGKIFILASGLSAGYVTLVILLVVSSIIGLFYYIRLVVNILHRSSDQYIKPFIISKIGFATLLALTVLILWLGIYPGSVIGFLEKL